MWPLALGGLARRVAAKGAAWLLPGAGIWMAGKGVENAATGGADLAREAGKTASSAVAIGVLGAAAVGGYLFLKGGRR